ncbi:gamma-aminobutyric acid receptor subunit beta-1-like isoform X1 [Mytilus californianus]|uniref:gamma-aminobutyric acid receptor subunit beta-1-like isoform X1 n=1 Tax=Mytilus californianus TaxID=6549 RepID=UPI002245F91E|nr:gamma-aminobutyric acid receptor subunit beta-1-like isoform X1 [Mytilus californianus]
MDEKAKRVYLKIVFLKITDIETVAENYAANVFIQARWREKKLDGNTKDKVNFSEYWSPKLVVQNLENSVLNNVWKEVTVDKNNEAYIVEKRRIKGTFRERQELHDFPFDFQEISVSVTSEHPSDEVVLLEDENEISSLTVTCFTGDHEWELRDFVEAEIKEISKDISDFVSATFPLLKLKTLARRKFGYFILNILLVMTFISCLPLTIFAVSRDLIENRIFLGFLLILIGVTFRFITNKVLPKISYLTTLDKYILACMIFMFLCTIWHSILSRIDDNDTQSTADLWAFVSLVILYALYHLIFISIVLIKYLIRRSSIMSKEQSYQEKAIRLMGDAWLISHKH